MNTVKSTTLLTTVLALTALTTETASFTISPTTNTPTFLSTGAKNNNRNNVSRLEAGGGWGKRTKEYTNDEFAREGGDRRGFDAYELQERGDFLRRVRNDQSNFLKRKDEEYLEIAKMAGITDQVGDGVEPMGEFSVDDEDYADIDVSVQWDEDDQPVSAKDPFSADYDPDASITRLDGDNDVAGALGQW